MDFNNASSPTSSGQSMNAANNCCRFALILVFACGSIVTGCNKPPYDLASVKGTVRFDGKPVTEGKVMFAPIAASGATKAGKPGFGQLSADGSFSISTYGDEDGAVVGDHWVTIINTAEDPNAFQPAFARVIVPQRQTVAADTDNVIDIQLSAAEVAKYNQSDD